MGPPPGWPTIVDPLVAWKGSEFRSDDLYTYILDNDEIAEIEVALAHFKGLGLDGRDVVRDNFPLPTLAAKLDALAEDLHDGRGFFAVRGLNPTKYSREDNIVIFLGVSSYVGELRGKQDDKGHIFAHIKEAKYMQEGQQERPIRDSNASSAFHTDLFADILAMQTRSCALTGGNHMVSSVATVYRELLATRPDLISVLAAPNWPFDTRGILTPPSVRPLLFHHDSRLLMSLVPDPLVGIPSIPRTKGLPSLSTLQIEALEVVEGIARRHCRVLCMQPGDLTFVNNLGVLHAREGFVDQPGRSERYLVRLWLRNAELGWELPEVLATGGERVFGEVEGVEEDWNVAFKPRLAFLPAERLSP
ncbi:hypothetical protein QBC39DRAFT_390275 [Podospora conica]|nr:hypothetical protein QBC39DRAFT_390275 [Schizothecium conicum]